MAKTLRNVTIREGRKGDDMDCGRIMCEAFTDLATRYYCRSDVPTVEMGVEFATAFIEDENVLFLVAEADGKIVGSNVLHKHNAVAGIGPITVEPVYQCLGIGKRLMEAALKDVSENKFERTRLCADAFNRISVPLYSSIGFRAEEVLAFVIGTPGRSVKNGLEIKKATESDLSVIDKLGEDIIGFSRSAELKNAIASGTTVIGIRDGKGVGYVTQIGLFGHGMAYDEADLRNLIINVAEDQKEISFLLPARRVEFFQWALLSGFKVEKFMMLMSTGPYSAPKGAYIPSVIY